MDCLSGLIRQVFLFDSFVHMSRAGAIGTVLIREVPLFKRSF